MKKKFKKTHEKIELNNRTNNFFYNIDSIELFSKEKMIILNGWAFSAEKKKEVMFFFGKNKNQKNILNKVKRLDVNVAYEIHENEKLGFKITIYNYSFKKSLKFILKDDSNNVCKIKINLIEYILKNISKNVIRSYKNKEKINLMAYLKYQLKTKELESYSYWVYRNEKYKMEQTKKEIGSFQYKPKISIVVPVYNVEKKWLCRFIDSLKEQYYENWELCIADDCSPSTHIKEVLEIYSKEDPRIKIMYRKKNGHISEATNSAIEMATGDYLAFMDNDDELAPFALYENVKKINECPNVDFIYSDEDKIDINGHRSDPFFKPEWNPRLLMSHNYITHFVVIKRELFNKIGLLKTEMNGAQDYDFVLRATEKAKEICHIPMILYHWRMIEGSTASNPGAKNYAYAAGKKAVEDALLRRGYQDYQVKIGTNFGTYDIDYGHHDQPLVSLIFKKEDPEKIAEIIKKIMDITLYPNYEIICPERVKKFLKLKVSENCSFRWNNLESDGSQYLNDIVFETDTEYLLFMDEYFYPVTPNWIEIYLNEAQNDGVGVVGGKLVYDRKIWSAGVRLDENGNAFFTHRDIDSESLGYYYRLVLPQNVFAVSQAGFFVSKKIFLEIEGFEFEDLKAILDFCIKVRKIGKEVVWTPQIELNTDHRPEEMSQKVNEKFLEKWSKKELLDPYTNNYLVEKGV